MEIAGRMLVWVIVGCSGNNLKAIIVIDRNFPHVQVIASSMVYNRLVSFVFLSTFCRENPDL